MEDLKKLLAAATPGPWYVQQRADQYTHIIRHGANIFLCQLPQAASSKANAALIVAAVNALPELLAERDRLRADLKRLFRPPYCRDKMEEEGKPVYPRSCAACNDWEAKGCPLSTKGAE